MHAALGRLRHRHHQGPEFPRRWTGQQHECCLSRRWACAQGPKDRPRLFPPVRDGPCVSHFDPIEHGVSATPSSIEWNYPTPCLHTF